MNAWPLLVTSDGSPTLVHPGHGEACHSRTGAWTEARERYARACRLRERARELAEDGEREFRLLDVGTGLGLNLAAAIEALDGTGLTLDAVSLELESSVIERTLLLARAGELHASSPAELVRAHAPVLDALGRVLAARERAPGRGARVWGAPEGVEAERVAPTRVAPELASPAHASDEQASAERVPPERVAMGDGRLLLLLGDGRVTLPALPRELRFDAVFLDAFSPGVDGALWQPAFLAELARRMAPGAILSTYSVSLSVRAGLAAAGLLLAPGGRVGTKAAGTLASNRPFPPGAAEFDPRTARRVARRARLLTDAQATAEKGAHRRAGPGPKSLPEG